MAELIVYADARSWRFRCRVMSVISLFTYIPFIVLVAIFVPRLHWLLWQYCEWYRWLNRCVILTLGSSIVMHHRTEGRLLSQTQEEVVLVIAFGLFWLGQ